HSGLWVSGASPPAAGFSRPGVWPATSWRATSGRPRSGARGNPPALSPAAASARAPPTRPPEAAPSGPASAPEFFFEPVLNQRHEQVGQADQRHVVVPPDPRSRLVLGHPQV